MEALTFAEMKIQLIKKEMAIVKAAMEFLPRKHHKELLEELKEELKYWEAE